MAWEFWMNYRSMASVASLQPSTIERTQRAILAKPHKIPTKFLSVAWKTSLIH